MRLKHLQRVTMHTFHLKKRVGVASESFRFASAFDNCKVATDCFLLKAPKIKDNPPKPTERTTVDTINKEEIRKIHPPNLVDIETDEPLNNEDSNTRNHSPVEVSHINPISTSITVTFTKKRNFPQSYGR
jgi:hypothetical protein